MSNPKNNRSKICFVSPYSYPLFNPGQETPFGGSEVRVSQIAKNLAKRGHFEISLIVFDHGQLHIEERDGITIYSWCEKPYLHSSEILSPRADKDRSLYSIARRIRKKLIGGENPLWRNCYSWAQKLFRGIRYFYQILRALFTSKAQRIGRYIFEQRNLAIYEEIDADIYIMHGNSELSAELAFYCRNQGKKYIFLAGSDMDYYPEYKTQPRQRDIYYVPYSLKTFAIENAHAHIVQNERQAGLLQEGYGRSSTLIRNPIDLNRLYPRNPLANNILWVGKSDERVKQPSLVLKLARQLPEFDFVIIMNPAVLETHHLCLSEAKKLPNVNMIEQVPFEKIESFFANARLHLNTSLFEGFPNTFLQAAKYGVPTLALNVDPGKMLSKHGCGHYFEGDFENIKIYIRKLMRNDRLTKKIEKQALSYVKKFHDQDLIIQQYEDLFHSVLEDSGDFSGE